MRGVFVALCLLTAVVASSTRADACSCRAPGPVCEELFFGTVFVGKAAGRADIPNTRDVRVTFEVMEVLHGAISTKTVDVETPVESSACGINFRVGTTYVVYAGGNAVARLATSACSRTHPVRDVDTDEDVVFARAAKKSTAKKARVTGSVSIREGSSQPGAGLEVRVKGTKIATRTDAKGTFVLDLAPGTYDLEVAAKGLRPARDAKFPLRIESAAGCPRPHLSMVWDGEIQGRVMYPDGTPASGARIVVRGKLGLDEAWRTDAKAGSDGRYVLREVEAGDWLVLVSPKEEGQPSWYSPHPTTFYPGTSDPKQAKRVSLARGGVAQNIDFVVPPPLTIVTFVGEVIAADGRRVPGADIGVYPAGVNRTSSVIADDTGAFAITEVEGLDVVLRACSRGARSKCTEVTTKVAPAMKRITLKLPK